MEYCIPILNRTYINYIKYIYSKGPFSSYIYVRKSQEGRDIFGAFFLVGKKPRPSPQDTNFHWIRMDQSGNWSHKPGGTPVRNTDAWKRLGWAFFHSDYTA